MSDDFGTFESLESTDQLARESSMEPERQLARAIHDAKVEFGGYFANSTSRKDFDERFKMASNDIHRVVAVQLTPTPGVIRKVKSALRPSSSVIAAAKKESDGWASGSGQPEGLEVGDRVRGTDHLTGDPIEGPLEEWIFGRARVNGRGVDNAVKVSSKTAARWSTTADLESWMSQNGDWYIVTRVVLANGGTGTNQMEFKGHFANGDIKLVDERDGSTRVAVVNGEVCSRSTAGGEWTPGVEIRASGTLASSKTAAVKTAWVWDQKLVAYVAELDDTTFGCPACGSANKLGFSTCACKKIWNSFPIESADKTASGRKVLCREVMDRSNSVLASVKSADSVAGPWNQSKEYDDLVELIKMNGSSPTDGQEEAMDLQVRQLAAKWKVDYDDVIDMVAGSLWGVTGSLEKKSYDGTCDKCQQDDEVFTFDDDSVLCADCATKKWKGDAMDHFVEGSVKKSELNPWGEGPEPAWAVYMRDTYGFDPQSDEEEWQTDAVEALIDNYDSIGTPITNEMVDRVVNQFKTSKAKKESFVKKFDPESDEREFTAGWHQAEANQLFDKSASKSHLEGYAAFLKQTFEPYPDSLDKLFVEKTDGVPNSLADDHEDYTDKSDAEAYKEVREDAAAQIDKDNAQKKDEKPLEDPTVGTPGPTKAP